LRFTIPGGAASESTFRSEIEMGTPAFECSTDKYQNVEHFIGFALYLNPDWPLADLAGTEAMRSVIAQQHTFNAQPGTSPLWGIRTSAGTFRLTTETGVNNTDVSIASNLQALRGTWFAFVLHIKYNDADAGWIRVYQGLGTAPLTLLRDTGNRNTVPPGTTRLGYYKFGNYTSSRKLNAGNTRTSYMDSLRIATSTNGGSLALVDPRNY
jgi:hypothetical protein